MVKFCSQCGTENQENAKFCVSCGGAFSEANVNAERASVENSSKNKPKFADHKSSFKEFYFLTQGRVGRQEFFFRAFMPITLLTIFLSFISNVLIAAESQSVQNMAYLVILLILTVGASQIIVSIKRFHDFNVSGWWSILLFVPLVNIIVLMVLFFKGSANSENRYGEEIGFYEQTPSRWVLFVVQFILILVLVVFNGLAKFINENQLQDGIKDTYEKANLAPVQKEKLLPMPHNNKWGFIDESGNWKIKPIYDSVRKFQEGLACVKIGEKSGYIDKEGNMIIQPIYDDVNYFSEGLASVWLGRKQGFIDKEGNMIIQPIYDEVDSFSEGLASVRLDRKNSFIDKKGNVVLQPVYDSAYSFSEGLAVVRFGDYKGGKHGFIDKKGNMIIQPIYDEVDSFSEGLSLVVIGEKYGFIDKKGNMIIQPIYDWFPFLVNSFSEELASVRLGRKYGFIDKKGNMVIQPIYDYAYSFSEGLAVVQFGDYEGGKHGFIDKKGNMIIQPIYDYAGSFSDGLAFVALNKKMFYINKKGEVAVTPKPIL